MFFARRDDATIRLNEHGVRRRYGSRRRKARIEITWRAVGAASAKVD
jgi:hypothetical protein